VETSADRSDDEGTIEVNMDAAADSQVTRRGSVKPDAASRDPDDIWADRSKKVQKRIAGMKRQFDQELANREAEFNRQLALRDERLNALEGKRSGVSGDDAAHEAAQNALQAQIEAAQEEGDSKKVAALMRQMSTADAQYWSAKTSKQLGNGAQPGTTTAAAAKPAARVPTKAGLAFTKANSDWWDDTDDTSREARAYANSLHTKMLADGDLDPETPEYFEEIRRKVQKRFPEIETVSAVKRRAAADDAGDDEEAPARETRLKDRGQAPTNFANRGDNANQRPRNVKVLTGAEQRAMRAVGMDPNNNKHVMAYVQSMNEGVS
jgi:hypothetical protein